MRRRFFPRLEHNPCGRAAEAGLRAAGQLGESFLLPRTGPRRDRNGEWDCYFTGGRMAVGVLRGVPPPSGK